MPIVFDDMCIQYCYEPDYLMNPSSLPYCTNPNEPIKELGLNTQKVELILDGGNVIKCHDTVITTDKVLEENKDLESVLDKLSDTIFPLKKLIIIPRDPDPEEIYGHADGMVRFIKQNHLLVNSQYPDEFKHRLHSLLKERGFKTTELQVKENTKYAWGYINFLHLDGLIILPAIDKTNDTYVKMQLQDLYPNTIIELCDAKPLLKKGGGSTALVGNCKPPRPK